MRYPQRCEVNLGDRKTRVLCREPGHWYVDYEGIYVCQEHAMEYLRGGSNEVRGDLDGDPVGLGADGELVRVA